MTAPETSRNEPRNPLTAAGTRQTPSEALQRAANGLSVAVRARAAAITAIIVLVALVIRTDPTAAIVFALAATPFALIAHRQPPQPRTVTLDGIQMTTDLPRDDEPGCYWLEDDGGIWKIGMAVNGKRRIAEHMRAAKNARTISREPIKIEFRYWTPLPNPPDDPKARQKACRRLEQQLHRQFRRTRISARWASTEMFTRTPGSALDQWLTRTENR